MYFHSTFSMLIGGENLSNKTEKKRYKKNKSQAPMRWIYHQRYLMVAIDPDHSRRVFLHRKTYFAPAGNRTRVCTVAGYYSTTRPLVLLLTCIPEIYLIFKHIELVS